MCHGLELRCRRQPYKNALPEKCSSTWLEYLKKYSVSDPLSGLCNNHMQRNDETYLSFRFSYDAVVTDNFGRVPYTLHTAHTCEYGLTSQFAHRWATFLVKQAYSGSFLGHTPVRTSNRHGSIM